jgi:hypothetical protein
MRHVWLAPRPGRFLAVTWVLTKGSSANVEGDLRAALHRFMFIVDPRQDLDVVEPVRLRFHEVERTARARYRRSRLAHAVVSAWPVVFFSVAISASSPDGGSTESALNPAIGVTVIYLLLTFAFAASYDRKARRSAQQIAEFAAPEVIRSRVLADSRLARRLVAQAENRSAGEQRQLLDILWRITEAEQVRTDYPAPGAEFDYDELAAIDQGIEIAEADLRAWSTMAPPPAGQNAP